MPTSVEIQQFTLPMDVYYVAEHLRAEDKTELETATGLTALEAVFRSWAVSEFTWVAHVNKVPAVVFGTAAGGVIWLVGTDAITKAALPIYRLARQVVPKLLAHYGRLYNHADIRNHQHLRWLHMLGFKFGAKCDDVNGHPFRPFSMEAPPCASPLPSSQA